MFGAGHQKPLTSVGGFANPADNALGYLNEYVWRYNNRDDRSNVFLDYS
jgi:hypothetical protein